MTANIVGDLLDLLPSTVTWSTLSSFDGYGDPTYSTGSNTARARLSDTPGISADQFGDDVVLTHRIVLASTSNIPATAQFTLPDGSQPNLLRVERVYDENGLHHQVAYFGARGG